MITVSGLEAMLAVADTRWESFAKVVKVLNPIQSVTESHAAGGANVVTACPTGTGKTLIAELAIHACLEQGRVAIYTAPLKALTAEKLAAWQAEGHPFRRLRISIVTGDFRLTESR